MHDRFLRLLAPLFLMGLAGCSVDLDIPEPDRAERLAAEQRAKEATEAQPAPQAAPQTAADPAATPTGDTPATPGGHAPTGGTGHCTAAETAHFSCPVKGGKVLSLCADAAGALQYRFGKIGSPELVFPSTPDSSQFTAEERSYVRSMGSAVVFDNQGVKYEVVSMIGGGGGSDEEAAANNFVGVYVKPPGQDMVSVGCGPDRHDGLEALVASGSVPTRAP